LTTFDLIFFIISVCEQGIFGPKKSEGGLTVDSTSSSVVENKENELVLSQSASPLLPLKKTENYRTIFGYFGVNAIDSKNQLGSSGTELLPIKTPHN